MITIAELTALLGVIWIDLVLAGDNAVVVGVAAAGLPRDKRAKVIMIGIAAATILRIIFAFLTTELMAIIGLTLAGGILLLWVCWKLWRELREQAREHKALAEMAGETHAAELDGAPQAARADNPDHGAKAAPAKTFRQAVTQIVVADVSMSLDNVLAIGGIARDHPTWILVVGLALSVAFMGAAATMIAGLLKRYHWIAYVGLAIIFYVSLHMIWDGSIDVFDATTIDEKIMSFI